MSSEHPLKGLAFCCTGIEIRDRELICHKIKSLGGTFYPDLMSDVNYLIVGDKQNPKYKYCIENRHDIEFLLPNSIFELYKKWIEGEKELSTFNLLDYKLPVFHTLNVCISRVEFTSDEIEDLFFKVPFRTKYYTQFKSIFDNVEQIKLLVKKYGGEATESLSLSNNCMISTELRGRRFQKAVEWNKAIVHPIYIIDCVIRGAPLDFDYYLVSNDNINSLFPDASNVWDKVVAENKELSFVYRPIATELRDANANKPLKKKKNAQIWDSIMSHTKSLQSLRSKRDTAWDQDDDENDEDEDGESVVEEGRNIQNPLLIKVIENHGGEITNDSNDSTITHIILPSSIGNSKSVQMLKILPSTIKSKINNNDIKIVTEWFIERSIFYKSIIYDKWSQPIKGLIKSNNKFKICLTGFTGIELLHIEKLINYLGFEFCDSLTNDKELLIININLFKTSLVKNSPALFKYKYSDVIDCPTYQIPTSNSSSSVSIISSKNKINAAKSWQIPIVSIAYLWEIMELSINKDIMIMPDILDLKWCIYAPVSMARPHSMLEYVKRMTSKVSAKQQLFKRGRGNENDDDEEDDTNNSDHHEEDVNSAVASSDENKENNNNNNNNNNAMRLPSPRKAKKKQKYGRIVGRESEDSLTAKLLKVSNGESNHKDGDSFINISNEDRGHEEEVDDDAQKNHDVTFEEDDNQVSQVGYQDNDSVRHNEALLKYLDNAKDMVVESDDEATNSTNINRRKQRNTKKVSKYSK
ncbi:DNA polymerase II complex component [Scheffersomyces coipomensis]|uniref:DNA polymerase II complex component n=1 Tax=Scheffersomyces coipomensis TaxID=1788519 RepID=UPI00315C89B1